MIIDVSERIDTAKRLTAEWAERAGYKQPAVQDETLSKKARDLQRIMNVSAFGCQQKNVHALLKVLIGEDFPIAKEERIAEYANREPFVIGSVLVPIGMMPERPGVITRISQRGSAGLRQSNGEMHNSHYAQARVRPATANEIDVFFSEQFGLTINDADNAPADEGGEADDDIAF